MRTVAASRSPSLDSLKFDKAVPGGRNVRDFASLLDPPRFQVRESLGYIPSLVGN